MKIERFPTTTNKSLRAWSAADEYLMQIASEHISDTTRIAILNDRFGYLSLHLHQNSPFIFTHNKSQEDGIIHNLKLNNRDHNSIQFSHLLQNEIKELDMVLMKIPKSMDLFHLFIWEAYQMVHGSGKILCGFMTRHFTKQMLDIASLYFENVEQSQAWKKSRVLTLSNPKKDINQLSPIHSIPFTNHKGIELIFKQYYGVFSAKHIDYATQFLLNHLEVDSSIERALDLACGNGIIAQEIRSQHKDVELHLIDDSYLAIESAKMNLTNGNNHFHYHYNLNHFPVQHFDLVVSNPPFHFEHENTIEISLQLFAGVARILKQSGSFVLVANAHLNYKTHLANYFGTIEIVRENAKFQIIRCRF